MSKPLIQLRALLLPKRARSGLHPIKSAQSTLELTISLAVLFLFLLGILKVFIWVNQTMVQRQQAFQETRINLGQPDDRFLTHRPSKLFIFGSEGESED